jgi:hypothetical protein
MGAHTSHKEHAHGRTHTPPPSPNTRLSASIVLPSPCGHGKITGEITGNWLLLMTTGTGTAHAVVSWNPGVESP